MRNDLFEYKHVKGGIYIKSYIGDKKEVEVPSIIDGKPVTIIGDGAFYNCNKLISVTIPDSVTSIGEVAFDSCYNLSIITLTQGLKSISLGKRAFYNCEILTSITIPSTLTNIEGIGLSNFSKLSNIEVEQGNSNYYVVDNCLIKKDTNSLELACKDIKEITIPDNITSIGAGAFLNCEKLKSITIPSSVTSIGDDAFHGCTRLTSITLPSSVSSIGKYAFKYCKKLKSVTIPKGVTSIGESAFEECYSLTSITIPEGVTSIEASVFSWCPALKKVIISDSVTSIGKYAFYECRSLTSIELSNSLTSIGEYAFLSCKNLESATIPDSVTSIGEGAFSGCDKLRSVVYNKKIDNFKSIFEGCKIKEKKFLKDNSLLEEVQKESVTKKTIEKKDVTKLLRECKDGVLTIPEGVTDIGEEAFYRRSSLVKVILPNSLISIGQGAFSTCWNLTSINIPSSVTSIGWSAFHGCTSLTSINIPSSVTSIEGYAFHGCTRLTSINIPSSVTSVGTGAFDECGNLKRINITDLSAWLNIDYQSYSANPLGGETNRMTRTENGDWEKIFYYKDLYLNGELLNDITIPQGITNIKPYAFASYKDLLNINITLGVTSIGEGAFIYCDNLTSVTIPESVTSIGEGAFIGCEKLTSVTIPSSVTSIGEGAFANCKKLTKIVVDQNNTRYRMIDNCLIDLDKNKLLVAIKNVKNVTIPENITSIEPCAFSGCTSLESVTIPSSVTSIKVKAFYNCSSLTSITIPEGVTSIKSNTFFGCRKLSSITIPEGVTSIESSAFEGCSSLKSIELPTSLTEIRDTVFKECSLSNIVIPINVASVGSNVFEDCNKLTRITIQNPKIQLGDDLLNNGWNDRCKLKSLKVPYGFKVTKKSFGDIKSSIISYEHFNEPTTCLDENGERIYDYGDKQIRIKLLSNMKFDICDITNNKKIKTLPKATKNEDSKVVGGFVEDFKNIKEEIIRKVDEYNYDIVASLNKGEEYSKTTFNNMFGNIITATMATGILWGLYDQNDNLKCAFRVLGKDNYVDINGSKVVIKKEDLLSIVDASQLSMDEVNKWKQILWSDNKSQLVRQFEAPIYYVPLNKLKERYTGATLEKQTKFETPYIILTVPFSYSKSLAIKEVEIKPFNINTMSSHEKRLLNRSIIDADKASLADKRLENLVAIGDLQGIKTAKETAIITADNIAHLSNVAIKQENAEVTAYLMELKKDMIGDIVDLDWEI